MAAMAIRGQESNSPEPWSGCGEGELAPNCAELRTFKLTFSSQLLKARQRLKIKPRRVYRNPVTLAWEWQAALENGDCSSKADIARMLGISRARVSQVLRLLRVSPEILDKIAAIGDPMPRPIVTECRLRPIVELPPVEQKRSIEATLPIVVEPSFCGLTAQK